MKKCALLSWILLGSVVLIAADYRIKTVKILPVESYPAKATVGDVTIALDPYDTDRKSLKAFDIRKLNSRGYFPLHVIIENASGNFLKLRSRDIILVIASGQHLYTTPSTLLLEDLLGAGLVSRVPFVGGGDSASSTKEGSAYMDFTSKELTDIVVDAGSVSEGFLFFFTPDPGKNLFTGSTLYVPKLEIEGSGKGIGPFTIPLEPALTPSPKSK